MKTGEARLQTIKVSKVTQAPPDKFITLGDSCCLSPNPSAGSGPLWLSWLPAVCGRVDPVVAAWGLHIFV